MKKAKKQRMTEHSLDDKKSKQRKLEKTCFVREETEDVITKLENSEYFKDGLEKGVENFDELQKHLNDRDYVHKDYLPHTFDRMKNVHIDRESDLYGS